MTTGVLLIVATYLIVAVILVTIILHLITKHHQTEIEREVEQLDKEKNLIASTPVLSELSKVEAIVKNDKMEERYKDWQRRFEQIKEEKLVRINDMIIDLDLFVENKDIKNLRLKIAKTEMEIYKARTAANKLLSEVQEITVSEEKYRHIITKLKTKYRELLKEFHDHESDYKDIKDAISLQFENIERRFADFEETMENNEYSEVVHIVKALDTMISHMGIVVSEVPNLVLLAEELIPKIQNDGWFDYDVVVATPDMMGVVGRLGKVLGPKGLMPNPKSGTVTMDITKAINEIKSGKVEYRLDKNNIIHLGFGKVSFGADKLKENYDVIMNAIIKAKPAAAKGQYVRSVAIATSMGPSIFINE